MITLAKYKQVPNVYELTPATNCRNKNLAFITFPFNTTLTLVWGKGYTTVYIRRGQSV